VAAPTQFQKRSRIPRLISAWTTSLVFRHRFDFHDLLRFGRGTFALIKIESLPVLGKLSIFRLVSSDPSVAAIREFDEPRHLGFKLEAGARPARGAQA